MSKLTFDITMSLDGFISGPNPRTEEPLGDGGERLHQWIYGLEAWRKDQGLEPPFGVPVFVLTHHAREPLAMKGGTTFTFMTDGPESALEQTRAAAAGKDVALAGGANVVQQYVQLGLLDEFQVHVSALFLGDGTRLFDHLGTEPIDLEVVRIVDSPKVTHLQYRIVR